MAPPLSERRPPEPSRPKGVSQSLHKNYKIKEGGIQRHEYLLPNQESIISLPLHSGPE